MKTSDTSSHNSGYPTTLRLPKSSYAPLRATSHTRQTVAEMLDRQNGEKEGSGLNRLTLLFPEVRKNEKEKRKQ